MIRPNSRASSYDDLAAEYYDPVRHPTCANFSELSDVFLVPRIEGYEPAGTAAILEVGVGRSTVAPVLQRRGLSLERLTLLDQSPGMLEHASKWGPVGARLLVKNACQTELPRGSFGLIVSALGDPYNCPAFWQEVARLLEPGGLCLFTTPAWEWASRFRAPHEQSYAAFEIAGGNTVLVPSKILPLDQQARMVADAGLLIVDAVGLTPECLSGTCSPKLLVTPETMRLPIVRGFTAQRP
jgi:SAM-dependent methyltransferase